MLSAAGLPHRLFLRSACNETGETKDAGTSGSQLNPACRPFQSPLQRSNGNCRGHLDRDAILSPPRYRHLLAPFSAAHAWCDCEDLTFLGGSRKRRDPPRASLFGLEKTDPQAPRGVGDKIAALFPPPCSRAGDGT